MEAIPFCQIPNNLHLFKFWLRLYVYAAQSARHKAYIEELN